jgi:hypothetical protein
MKKTKIFESEFLNEQLALGHLGVFDRDLMTKKIFEAKAGISGKSLMIELFPNNRNNYTSSYFYDRKLKDKMIYRLKKEGFKFVPWEKMVGYYLKEL